MPPRITKAQKRRVQEVIDQAGGRSRVAEYFEISWFAVSKWYHSGVVPPTRVQPLVGLANAENEEKRWTPDEIGPYLV